MFSRQTKATRWCSSRGKETNLMNIWFSNSVSLITAITNLGDAFSASIYGSTTSKIFIEFIKEFGKFLLDRNGLHLFKCLIIMNNASVHRSTLMKNYFNENHLNVVFLPAYSPELAPVERYFSMLKKKVIRNSYGLQANWRSEKGSNLLKKIYATNF